jgi:hypothetical protein
LTFWLVTSAEYDLHLRVYQHDDQPPILSRLLQSSELQRIPIGSHAFINLINVKVATPLPEETLLSYDFDLLADDQRSPLTALIADLVYAGNTRPTFAIKNQLSKVLHGSCRKPHFDSGDGLLQMDHLLLITPQSNKDRHC